MSDRALVSVVIPTYNRAHVLAECLESVLGQTWPRLEVIVVDDGSTDGTDAVLARYGGRVETVRQENRGISAARNAGQRRARGEFVAWMDSDDVWVGDKIAIEMAVLAADPSLLMVSSDFSAFDGSRTIEESHIGSYYSVIDSIPGGLPGIYRRADTLALETVDGRLPERTGRAAVLSGRVYESLVWGNFIHPPTILLRASAARAAGDLDESLRNCMEYDFFLRLSRLGRCAHVDLPLLRYRYSADQVSSEAHRVEIRLSILQILERIEREDPALVRAHAARFRARLGSCRVGAALALAEERRGAAMGHLLRSLPYVERRSLTALVKLAVPGWALRLRRATQRGLTSG